MGMPVDELKALHWQTLKKMMEDAGLEFKSKDQAVEELAKLDPPAEDPAPPSGDTGAAGAESNPPTAGDPPKDDPTPDDAAPAAAGPTFKRNAPYGEICGEVADAPGARFLQGGFYFNNAGEVVGKA